MSGTIFIDALIMVNGVPVMFSGFLFILGKAYV